MRTMLVQDQAWSSEILTHQLVAVALIFAVVILVGSVAIGVFGFNPERAQAIRTAEADNPVVVEEIRHVHVNKRERFRHGRVDRHIFYLGFHLAVWFYSWCVFSNVTLTSNVTSMTEGTRQAMATCFLIGSTLVLSGAAMGAEFFGHRFLNAVHDNVTSSLLGDDIRMPYTFACAGMGAIGVSTTIYAYTSFQSTVGSLGGWLTGVAAFCCVGMIAVLFGRIRQFTRVQDRLIAEAVARLEARADDDDAAR